MKFTISQIRVKATGTERVNLCFVDQIIEETIWERLKNREIDETIIVAYVEILYELIKS